MQIYPENIRNKRIGGIKHMTKFKVVNLYEPDTLKPPKPYCGIREIKAIVLGTDPTAFDKHANVKQINYVFDINGDERYFVGIKHNLNYLFYKEKNFFDSIENYLFVQNLCPNYLEHQTSEYNNKSWINFMVENGYVEKLKIDIGKYPNIPLFLTSSILLDVLCDHGIVKKPSYYYENQIFIEPEDNKLNRLLIPLFRHRKYALYHDENLAYTNAVRKRLNILHD